MSRIGVIEVPWKLLGVPLSLPSKMQFETGRRERVSRLRCHFPLAIFTDCLLHEPAIVCALVHMHQGRYSNASTKINDTLDIDPESISDTK